MLHSDTQTEFISACVCFHMCVFPHVCMCLCKEHAYRPQHTDGRLIKQLIKARALGSEMRLRLFGKNCSTHHKKEGEGRTGRVGGEKESSREREREYQSQWPGMCQSLSCGAPPPIQPLYPPFLRPHSVSLSVFVCVALSLSDSNQNLRKLFKSKAVIALQKFLQISEKAPSELRREHKKRPFKTNVGVSDKST